MKEGISTILIHNHILRYDRISGVYVMNECHCSVKVQGLSVKKNNNIILNNISFAINHGEILALIGKNGAGKTTLLKAIINSIPHSGLIGFFNSEGKKISNPKIGYVPQHLGFDKNTPMTVLDLFCSNSKNMPIWLGRSKKRVKKAKEMLKKVGAESHLNKPIGALSGGELQRVLLAFALDPMPDILLLDEPLSAVDRKGVGKLYSVLVSMREEYHMPIILVSHDLGQVYRYANTFVLIDKHIIETGKSKEMYKSQKVKEIFGFDLESSDAL
ncbi:MAG: metal ABC transporter ATP-binding protein [Oscillospiraceae bacterium]|nr:metal ABC transporter ATP-binding protein [Oscillospiraceae bacterium]